jgi:hypothetical protein
MYTGEQVGYGATHELHDPTGDCPIATGSPSSKTLCKLLSMRPDAAGSIKVAASSVLRTQGMMIMWMITTTTRVTNT